MRLSTIAKDMKAAGHSVVTRRGINVKKVFVRNLEFSKVRGEKQIFVFDSNEMEMFPMTGYIINDDGSVHITIIKDGEFVGRDYWKPMMVPKNHSEIKKILLCEKCFYHKRQIASGNVVEDCDCVSRREMEED